MRHLIPLLLTLGLLCSATLAAEPTSGHVDTGAMTIYEVNIRQFSEEGTFDAFTAHVPRLADLGVDILWLMPIHPISEAERKGSLGSYYAAADYKAVNPEFGTDEDLRQLIAAAHAEGMLVILDWVANHTGADHVWTRTHPGRFARDADGGFRPPNDDWTDVLQLDMNNPDTRRAMHDAMRYWVHEFDVDGFRCDVAELVPGDFWRSSIKAMRLNKPLFMLAEGHADWLHDVGFDATYGWGLGDTLIRAARGEANALDVREQIERNSEELEGHGRDPFRMQFTSNHDWNSWNGTDLERYGSWAAHEAATVLMFTAPGMPLIYNGQEAGLDHRLAFFEKDEIPWAERDRAELYRRLATLKEREAALRHGRGAGEIEFFDAGHPERVLGFRRTNEDSEVIVIANLSAAPATIASVPLARGATYTGLDGYPAEAPTDLPAWGWAVLTRAAR